MIRKLYSLRSIACVAWRFWLGELSNKGGRGQRNREEIGAGATKKIREGQNHVQVDSKELFCVLGYETKRGSTVTRVP